MSAYPHAEKYLTKEALEKADEQTKRTWEFEATVCDEVVEVMGGETCPQCNSQIFRIGDTIIDFHYPFVHSFRIRVTGPRNSSWVKCEVCGLAKKRGKHN